MKMSTETEVIKSEPKKKKPKNYINNTDLMIEIDLSRKQGKMTNKLAQMLMLLVERYSKHPDYANIYSYVDDMKSFALLTLVKVWVSFNPEKSKNPFAYFTQIIRHAFYQYLNHEKKQREIKDEILIDQGEAPSFTYMENYHEKLHDISEANIPEVDQETEKPVIKKSTYGKLDEVNDGEDIEIPDDSDDNIDYDAEDYEYGE